MRANTSLLAVVLLTVPAALATPIPSARPSALAYPDPAPQPRAIAYARPSEKVKAKKEDASAKKIDTDEDQKEIDDDSKVKYTGQDKADPTSGEDLDEDEDGSADDNEDELDKKDDLSGAAKANSAGGTSTEDEDVDDDEEESETIPSEEGDKKEAETTSKDGDAKKKSTKKQKKQLVGKASKKDKAKSVDSKLLEGLKKQLSSHQAEGDGAKVAQDKQMIAAVESGVGHTVGEPVKEPVETPEPAKEDKEKSKHEKKVDKKKEKEGDKKAGNKTDGKHHESFADLERAEQAACSRDKPPNEQKACIAAVRTKYKARFDAARATGDVSLMNATEKAKKEMRANWEKLAAKDRASAAQYRKEDHDAKALVKLNEERKKLGLKKLAPVLSKKEAKDAKRSFKQGNKGGDGKGDDTIRDVPTTGPLLDVDGKPFKDGEEDVAESLLDLKKKKTKKLAMEEQTDLERKMHRAVKTESGD